MDDLKNKTDQELMDLMRASISNQYVPSSVYHRAKQELDFRKMNPTQQYSNVAPTAVTVLRTIANSKRSTDATGKFMPIELLEHQFGSKRMPKVREALAELIDHDFVEEIEDYKGMYRLTPFGDDYLISVATANVTSYSHITNSNIAHESPSAQQTIDINELPQDIQESIRDLKAAASSGDPSAMKKIFAYITDKAVDVAIAIALGHLKLG